NPTIDTKFFFHAGESIPDRNVAGVQTAALPIYNHRLQRPNSLNSLAEAEKGLRATSNKHAVLIRGAAKAAMDRGCALRDVADACPDGDQGVLSVIKSSSRRCPFWTVLITICSVV